MKKLLFIAILFATTIIVTGQVDQRVYLATQPFDFGMGVRYDACIERVGVYTSASYGNGGLYRVSGLQNHVKLTAGLMFAPYKKHDFYVTAGANYHYADFSKAQPFIIGTPIRDRWSFELGVTQQIVKRIAIGLRTDILRWEPCVDIGFCFPAKK